MKKLAIFIAVLISLTLLAGCNHSKKTVTKFSSDENNGTTTTVTTITDEEEVEQTPIEIPAEDENKEAEKVSEKGKVADTVPFAVTAPKENVVRSDKGYHLIQGTTPESTEKIVINGYTLNKYKAGKTEWSYIAAASLGTLKKGENRYTVSAFDKDNNKLGSRSFSIVYQGIDNVSLVSTGSNTLSLALILTFAMSLAFFWVRKMHPSKES